MYIHYSLVGSNINNYTLELKNTALYLLQVYLDAWANIETVTENHSDIPICIC